jgi:hypothetical protein
LAAVAENSIDPFIPGMPYLGYPFASWTPRKWHAKLDVGVHGGAIDIKSVGHAKTARLPSAPCS